MSCRVGSSRLADYQFREGFKDLGEDEEQILCRRLAVAVSVGMKLGAHRRLFINELRILLEACGEEILKLTVAEVVTNLFVLLLILLPPPPPPPPPATAATTAATTTAAAAAATTTSLAVQSIWTPRKGRSSKDATESEALLMAPQSVESSALLQRDESLVSAALPPGSSTASSDITHCHLRSSGFGIDDSVVQRESTDASPKAQDMVVRHPVVDESESELPPRPLSASPRASSISSHSSGSQKTKRNNSRAIHMNIKPCLPVSAVNRCRAAESDRPILSPAEAYVREKARQGGTYTPRSQFKQQQQQQQQRSPPSSNSESCQEQRQ